MGYLHTYVYLIVTMRLADKVSSLLNPENVIAKIEVHIHRLHW